MGSSNYQGRLHHPFCDETSLDHYAHRNVVGTSSSPNRGTKTLGEKGSRKGSSTSVSGFLQSSLSCSKERRPVEANHRSVDSEWLPRHSVFQDGDFSLHQGFGPTWPLGCITRSDRRILSRTNTPQLPEVLAFLPKQSSLSIPGASFWPLYSASSIYKTHGRSRSLSSSERFCSPSVLRRLAPTSEGPRQSSIRSCLELERLISPGSPSQPSEVGPHSLTGFHLRRHEFSHCPRSYKTSASQSSCSNGHGVLSAESESGDSQVLSVTARGAQCSSGPCISRAPSFTPYSVPPSVYLETQQRQSLGLDSYQTLSSSIPSLVVRSRETIRRGTSDSPFAFPTADYRFKQGRLGCAPRTFRSLGIRNMDCSGVSTPYKQSGAQSSETSSLTFSVTDQEQLCPGLHRQHHGCLPYSKTGWDSFPISVSGNTSPIYSVPRSWCLTSSQTHSGETQRLSRRSVSKESDPPFGMDPPPNSSQSDLPDSRASNGGFVCNKAQSSSTTVCVTSDGSKSLGPRCSISRLEQSSGLCLSSVHPNPSGFEEDSVVKVPSSSCSTLVAPEIVVQRSLGTFEGGSSSPSRQNRPSFSKKQCSSSKSTSSASSRLAVIRLALRKKRFSERASSLIASSRRSSTSTVYNAKWKIYSSWCIKQEIDPLRPSIRRVADFFIYLFDEKKLAVSTIKGYRSMISHTLSFRGACSIGSDCFLSELIRSFELKRPVSRSLTPKWNLSCVLWSLTKDPYEPINQSSLQFLTWKTVFLLTLASAKRRSEIHALSVEDGHLRFNAADGSVSLLCQSGFLAKTQLPSSAPTAFSVPSLSNACGEADKDRLLCPVRALKYYLSRVKSLRGNRKRLFIPIKGKSDISAASISRWIASTIRKAYSSLSERDCSLFSIKAHEVRALSASWAFVNHTPLEDILQATFWKNSSTFSSFYLRSFASQSDNLYLLGPFVAAQSVISPPTSL